MFTKQTRPSQAKYINFARQFLSEINIGLLSSLRINITENLIFKHHYLKTNKINVTIFSKSKEHTSNMEPPTEKQCTKTHKSTTEKSYLKSYHISKQKVFKSI